MGALAPDEMAMVGDAVARHPALRAELEKISRVLEGIAPVDGVAPSDGLRDTLLARFAQEHAPTSSDAGSTGAQESTADTPGSTATIHRLPEDAPQPIGTHSAPRRTWLLAASIAAFLVSSATALWFYNELEGAREELVAANVRADGLEDAFVAASDKLRRLHSAHNRVVRMASTDNAPTPTAFAVLYWNAESETVWVDATSMPPLPDDKQYQLWAIPEGGAPVDAGVFDGADGELRELKQVHTAHTFAVTVEPKGGSETPTLETMTVIGEV